MPCDRGSHKATKSDADRSREKHVQREIERLTDAVAQMGLSRALAERLGKAEAERDALKLARTRASVAPLRSSTIRAQVRALVTGLDVALRADIARARDALRAVLGDVQLIEENGAVYAECDNAAERLLLAVRRRVDGSGCGGPQTSPDAMVSDRVKGAAWRRRCGGGPIARLCPPCVVESFLGAPNEVSSISLSPA